MSRCFPFPPPGYAGKSPSSNEALILSIKLQREREIANSDREREKAIPDREREKAKSSDRKKDRKREKKEKKRDEKEKSKSAEKQKRVEKLYQADKCGVEPHGKCIMGKDESELLEKSTLTEEHDRPVASQNVSCSTDSTGNSSKRKRYSSPPSSIQSHGSIIRIRLSSSQKREDPSTSGSKDQEIILPSQKKEAPSTSYSKVRPCSNLLRTESCAKQKDVVVKAPQDPSISASTSGATFQLPSLPVKKTEPVPVPVKEEKLSSHERKMMKKELAYKKLFEAWVPPLLQSELVDDEDDEEWLFGKKGEEKPAKRLKSSGIDAQSCGGDNPATRCASAVLQPRAHFLPDVEIYALPFTVPF